MKRTLLAGSAALCLITATAVPLAVQARNGADDGTNHVRREDRQADRREDRATSPSAISLPTVSNNIANNLVTDTNGVSNVSDDTASTDTTTASAVITLEEAKAKAAETTPDKTFRKAELEMEHGVQVWEIKFTDGSQVKIDATTGEVLSARVNSNNGNHNGEDHSNSGSNNSGSSHGGRDHSEDD